MISIFLLPGFWHGTEPNDKKKIFNGGFTADCVQEMNGSEYSIRFTDMHTLRVCYELAREHPEHLERGVPTDDDISHVRNAQNNNQTAVEEAREQA